MTPALTKIFLAICFTLFPSSNSFGVLPKRLPMLSSPRRGITRLFSSTNNNNNNNNDPDAIMSDDPMIVKLEELCAQLNGGDWNQEVGLVQLLNPSKVVNLERELIDLRSSLESAANSADLVADLEGQIRVKEAKQIAEMRGVMRDWLKALFVWQSVLSVLVCGLVAYDAVPFVSPGLEIYVRVLGFWGIWLFTIPSLRSRKPGGTWGMSSLEKSALDVAFLLTPITNLAMPQVTKDPPTIFWANLVVTAACYGWYLVGPGKRAAEAAAGSTGGGGSADASLPGPIKFVLTAMDFGGGSEKGLSMETREKLETRNKQDQQEQQDQQKQQQEK